MSERPVTLDLSTSSSGMRDSSMSQDRPRAGTDEEARRQFEAALQDAEDAPNDPPIPAQAPTLSSLLQRAVPSDARPKRDLALLRSTLSGLFVGDGHGGKRQTGMQLSDDVLPGVVVTVYEDGGAWVADFVCANDDSRDLLCAEAQPMAQEMADTCARRAGWRVMTDDSDDLRLREFWADPAR